MRRLGPSLMAAFLAACAGPAATIHARFDFSSVRRVALLGFDDFPGMRGSGVVVASVFEKHLLTAGYGVVERRRVRDLLREQSLSVSGAVDPRTARSLGRLLGVDALVLGSLTAFSPSRQDTVMVDRDEVSSQPILRHVVRREKVGDEWVSVGRDEVAGYHTTRTRRSDPQTHTTYAQAGVAARMVDVKTGEILWVGSSTESGYSLDAAAEAAAKRIMVAVKRTWPVVLERQK